MEIIRFLNRVTGNHLLLWKAVAATVVFTLSGLQVMLAARFWQVAGFPSISVPVAARLHRITGRVALTLAVVVALTCLIGPAGPLSPTRVALHSIFGALVFVILAVKFSLLKLIRAGERALPWVGMSLFLSFGVIWATSVADYLSKR